MAFPGQCTAEKPDGSRCEAFAMTDGSELCYFHNPATEEARKKSTKKGGASGSTRRPMVVVDPAEAPPPPQTMKDATKWASWATFAVATGKLGSHEGHKVGTLLQAFMRGLEKSALEEEIRDLKAELAKVRKGSK